jgi:hypothetical protein
MLDNTMYMIYNNIIKLREMVLMGATSFMFTIDGDNVRQAYSNAVEDALHYHGHDNYNGTISTTRGVREFTWTKSKQFPTPQDYADHLMMNGTIQKWGSAGCILIKSEKKDVEKIETKVVKVEKIAPTKKEKTWWTIYVVKLKDGTVISNHQSKTDATKRATEEVKKRGVEIVIEQQKALKQGSPIELTLKPQIKQEKKKEKKTVNTYLMFGWAAC